MMDSTIWVRSQGDLPEDEDSLCIPSLSSNVLPHCCNLLAVISLLPADGLCWVSR